MNYWTRFLPDIMQRTFSGKTADGRVVPKVERMAFLRFLVYLGTLEMIRRTTKEVTGTAIDYVGEASPMPLSASPQWKLTMAAVNVTQGLIGRDDKKFKMGMRDLGYSVKVFVPYMLGIKELYDLLAGNIELPDYLFYTDKYKGSQKKYQVR